MRFIMGLLLGVVLGASIGLLVATQQGSETGRALRDKMRHHHEEEASTL